jgi:hypothetical protein
VARGEGRGGHVLTEFRKTSLKRLLGRFRWKIILKRILNEVDGKM